LSHGQDPSSCFDLYLAFCCCFGRHSNVVRELALLWVSLFLSHGGELVG
jgi:hypothetical protein